MNWTLARRAEKMNPSVIREILKVTEKPGIIGFAGGLPSPKTFPVEAFAAACDAVLRTDGRAALQYASSEGLPASIRILATRSRPCWLPVVISTWSGLIFMPCLSRSCATHSRKGA